MDPRYEEGIDEIVKGMDGEFTARMVADTLERMHPDLPVNTTRPLPSAMTVSKHLKCSPGVEKTGRKGIPLSNYYRYDEDWDKAETEPATDPVEVVADTVVDASVADDEEPPPLEEGNGLAPGEPLHGGIPLELQDAMAKIQACSHEGGWRYQEAMEICVECGGVKDYVDPIQDKILDMTKALTPMAIIGLTNRDTVNLYMAFMQWSSMIDKTAKGGKAMADQYAAWAEACALKLQLNARKHRKNIMKV